jgi:hypothetical protein
MYGRTKAGSPFRLSRSDPICKRKTRTQQPHKCAACGFLCFEAGGRTVLTATCNPPKTGSTPVPSSRACQDGRRALLAHATGFNSRQVHLSD